MLKSGNLATACLLWADLSPQLFWLCSLVMSVLVIPFLLPDLPRRRLNFCIDQGFFTSALLRLGLDLSLHGTVLAGCLAASSASPHWMTDVTYPQSLISPGCPKPPMDQSHCEHHRALEWRQPLAVSLCHFPLAVMPGGWSRLWHDHFHPGHHACIYQVLAISILASPASAVWDFHPSTD